MAKKHSSRHRVEAPQTDRDRPSTHDLSAAVRWWKSHGKPSATAVADALGIPYVAVWQVLRDQPGYVGRKYQGGRPNGQARRAAIVAWWRAQGKPRLGDVAREFKITGERVRQVLSCESDYDRGGQGPMRQKIKAALEAHPEWTPEEVVLNTKSSISMVRSIARDLGVKFPRNERSPYTPRGRVLQIVKLHNQGLRRPDIAHRLGIKNCVVFMSLDRVMRRSPDLLKFPIVDGRRVGRVLNRTPRIQK